MNYLKRQTSGAHFPQTQCLSNSAHGSKQAEILNQEIGEALPRPRVRVAYDYVTDESSSEASHSLSERIGQRREEMEAIKYSQALHRQERDRKIMGLGLEKEFSSVTLTLALTLTLTLTLTPTPTLTVTST